ncbi:sigma-70 family RNA polymerase sigma factor [Brevibacillus sp. SIMBA_040]|uniref:sigma-70 family RNA polymerase sigma factor n=1 Tax=unclassified Brevibacillus TaxID=2684853 RepID=UPI00397D628E
MNVVQLVKAAQAGNTEAFQELIEQHRERMYRMAYYYVRNDADAEDVVHEAIYKALVSLPRLKQPSYFVTWLTRIVINCALVVLQRRKRTVLDGDQAVAQLPAAAFAADERLDLLDAIRGLELKQRQVILYKYFQDLTIEDIAVLLNLPVGTVKSILHKGLKVLRKHFETDVEQRAGKSEADMEAALQRLQSDLKLRAESLIVIPEQYELLIDDYREHPREGGRALFVWTEPGTDHGISVELSKKGDLLEYTIETADRTEEKASCSEDELRAQAEKFVLDHYPKAMEQFVLIRSKQTKQGISFVYGQKVMGLFLPNTGFRVYVSWSGTVIEFQYRGRQKSPEIPQKIVSKERLLKRIADLIDFRLYMSFVRAEGQNVPKDELRLVYQPSRFLSCFDADEERLVSTSEDFNRQEEESDEWTPVPMQSAEDPDERAVLRSIHDLIGIDSKKYEIIREIDMDGRHGIVWRRKDWKPSVERDLSLESFFLNRSEESIKAFTDPDTGRLISFIRFEETKGDLRLSRDECLERALQFLKHACPGMEPFLLLKQDEERDLDSEVFAFHVHKDGVLLYMERIVIVINKTTGQPNQVSGLTVTVDQLKNMDVTPSIEVAEARQMYLAGIELRLEWEIDYAAKAKKRRYRLCYKAVHKKTGLEVRMVDAKSRELICW